MSADYDTGKWKDTTDATYVDNLATDQDIVTNLWGLEQANMDLRQKSQEDQRVKGHKGQRQKFGR